MVVLGWFACTGSPTTGSGSTETGSTETGTIPTTTPFPCDLPPTHLVQCAHTTATIETGGSGTTNASFDHIGHGVVTEVGTAVRPVGSEIFEQLGSCSGPMDRLVVVDDDGASWSFGVSEAPADFDLAATVAIGTEVTFVVRWNESLCSPAASFVLADAVGPLWVVERGAALLTAEERGGLGVVVNTTDICPGPGNGGFERHDRIDLAWPGGEVSLRTSGRATVPLASRDLLFFLAEAYRDCDDCFCANDRRGWIAWASP